MEDADLVASNAKYLNDPAAFIQDYWPGSIIYDKQLEVLESVRDNDETFVHAAHEMGKCLDADERIILADGRVVVVSHLVGKFFAVPGFDESNTPKLAWAEDNGIEPVFKITTKTGRQITRTAKHPLFCGNFKARSKKGSGATVENQGFRHVDAICVGDMVLVPTKLDVDATIRLPDDHVKLIGYLLGDGGTIDAVEFTQSEGRIGKEEVRQIVSRLGAKCVDRNDLTFGVAAHGLPGMEAGRNPVLNLVKSWGMMGKSAKTKSFPDVAWQLPNEQLAMMLNRLFSCDGWAYSTRGPKKQKIVQVGICLASEKMIRDIEIAMLRFGIPGRVRERSMKNPKSNHHNGKFKRFRAWEWSVLDADSIRRFSEQIGIFGKDDDLERAMQVLDRQDYIRRRQWHVKNAPAGYKWDKVASVESLGSRPTVAIQVDSEEFVTTFVEHNSRVAAWLVLWWFSTRFPARVITSSSGEKQLKGILWAELDVLIRTAAKPLAIDQQTLKLQVIDPVRSVPFGEHYVVGHVTNKVENFQGHHLALNDGDPPRVLFIYDEASGIDDIFYDTGQSQAHRLLAISNPLTTDGFLFRMCKMGDAPDPNKPGRFHRKVIHIDGLDSPNVKIGMKWKSLGLTGQPPTVIPGLLSWSEYQRRERIWDEMKRKMRLHGLFYEGEEHLMFPPLWLDSAEDAWEEVSKRKRGPCYMGVDTAEGGGDDTVWTVIDWLGIVDIVVLNTKESEVINPITMKLMAKWHIPSRHVVFDKGGGGSAHVRYLRAKGIRVRGTYFSEKPMEPKEYKNRRAEIYGLLRKALTTSKWTKIPPSESGQQGDLWRRCFAIPADGSDLFSPDLREELSVLPMLYDAEGKVFLPPKNRTSNTKASANKIKTIREMIGRSPDRSDSLALAVYARDGGVIKTVAKVDRDMAADPAELDRARRESMQPQQPGQPAPQRPKTLEERLFGQGGGRSRMGSEDSLWG